MLFFSCLIDTRLFVAMFLFSMVIGFSWICMSEYVTKNIIMYIAMHWVFYGSQQYKTHQKNIKPIFRILIIIFYKHLRNAAACSNVDHIRTAKNLNASF